MRIKICGIRRDADVEIMNEFLPDYAGFVFAESKRRVNPKRATALIAQLDRRISRVGVFVNPADSLLLEAVESGLNVVQLHGGEDMSRVKELRELMDIKGFGHVSIWKSIRVKDADSLLELDTLKPDAWLLDGWHPTKAGGTGKVFDWSYAEKFISGRRIMMAGGLTPDNIEKQLSLFAPWGIDVSSGVEKGGKKDAGLVRDFILAARRYIDGRND